MLGLSSSPKKIVWFIASQSYYFCEFVGEQNGDR